MRPRPADKTQVPREPDRTTRCKPRKRQEGEARGRRNQGAGNRFTRGRVAPERQGAPEGRPATTKRPPAPVHPTCTAESRKRSQRKAAPKKADAGGGRKSRQEQRLLGEREPERTCGQPEKMQQEGTDTSLKRTSPNHQKRIGKFARGFREIYPNASCLAARTRSGQSPDRPALPATTSSEKTSTFERERHGPEGRNKRFLPQSDRRVRPKARRAAERLPGRGENIRKTAEKRPPGGKNSNELGERKNDEDWCSTTAARKKQMTSRTGHTPQMVGKKETGGGNGRGGNVRKVATKVGKPPAGNRSTGKKDQEQKRAATGTDSSTLRKKERGIEHLKK